MTAYTPCPRPPLPHPLAPLHCSRWGVPVASPSLISKQPQRQHTAAHAANADNQVGDPLPQRQHAAQQQQQQQQQQRQQAPRQQEFQQTLEAVQQLSYSKRQQLLEDQPEHNAFSASFLFWLSAQEKKAVGPRQQALAQLAAQLVLMKEQADAEASRRMLPPLASSLGYSNYLSWRSSNSEGELPDVTAGVPLTDFYRAAEREEAKLQQWETPQRPSSTLDNFAAASGYSSFAADAMARVRARLAGYDSDDSLQQQQEQRRRQQEQQQQQQPASAGAAREAGVAAVQGSTDGQSGVSPAALRVLDELLLNCCCREERATLLPEACMPPGLEVSATGSASTSVKARVLTSPQRLLAAVSERLAHFQQQQQQPETLPSGEAALQALQELQEDIQEYDTHVYSRLSQRDLQGL